MAKGIVTTVGPVLLLKKLGDTEPEECILDSDIRLLSAYSLQDRIRELFPDDGGHLQECPVEGRQSVYALADHGLKRHGKGVVADLTAETIIAGLPDENLALDQRMDDFLGKEGIAVRAFGNTLPNISQVDM